MHIMLIDDHLLFLESIVAVLSKRMSDVNFSYHASLAEAKRSVSTSGMPDAVLLDYHMPGYSGAELLDETCTFFSESRIAILSGRITRFEIQDAISKGVCGFLLKDIPINKLVSALTKIIGGGVYIPHAVMAEQASRGLNDNIKLTPREKEVLILLHQGDSNKNIANKLDIAEVTAKMHFTNLFKKYDVRNRTELAIKSAEDIVTRSA